MRRVDKMRIIILTMMLLYGISCMSLVHGYSTARRTFGKLILIDWFCRSWCNWQFTLFMWETLQACVVYISVVISVFSGFGTWGLSTNPWRVPSLPSPFSSPFPSPPLPLPSHSLPLKVGPLLRLGGLGERLNSPSGSGRSPAAKRFLVLFELKILHVVSCCLDQVDHQMMHFCAL